MYALAELEVVYPFVVQAMAGVLLEATRMELWWVFAVDAARELPRIMAANSKRCW
jgi:hypothetical protein